MKKLLETSLGNGSETAFNIPNGPRILDTREIVTYLKEECNPYRTKNDQGTLVYLSKEELEAYETYLEERGKRQ